jgi:hypothetical protein
MPHAHSALKPSKSVVRWLLVKHAVYSSDVMPCWLANLTPGFGGRKRAVAIEVCAMVRVESIAGYALSAFGAGPGILGWLARSGRGKLKKQYLAKYE